MTKLANGIQSNAQSLGFNSVGVLSTQLPQGPASDSFKLYVYVNIIDDWQATTVYNLVTAITCMPNTTQTTAIIQAILGQDMSNSYMDDINSGKLSQVAQNAQVLAAQLNYLSSLTPVEINQMASIREYLVDKVSALSIGDMSSIKAVSSALSATTTSYEQISSTSAVRSFFFLAEYRDFYLFNIHGEVVTNKQKLGFKIGYNRVIYSFATSLNKPKNHATPSRYA